ncbi:MAG: hypothetical protein AAF212_05760 [Verrucomicrobiota bacterium]
MNRKVTFKAASLGLLMAGPASAAVSLYNFSGHREFDPSLLGSDDQFSLTGAGFDPDSTDGLDFGFSIASEGAFTETPRGMGTYDTTNSSVSLLGTSFASTSDGIFSVTNSKSNDSFEWFQKDFSGATVNGSELISVEFFGNSGGIDAIGDLSLDGLTDAINNNRFTITGATLTLIGPNNEKYGIDLFSGSNGPNALDSLDVNISAIPEAKYYGLMGGVFAFATAIALQRRRFGLEATRHLTPSGHS